jgi:hypothetical protein
MTQITFQIAINLPPSFYTPPPNSFLLSRTHFVLSAWKFMRKQKDLSGRNCLIFHLNLPILCLAQKEVLNFPINHKISTKGKWERKFYLFICCALSKCDRGKLENYDLSSLLSNKMFSIKFFVLNNERKCHIFKPHISTYSNVI